MGEKKAFLQISQPSIPREVKKFRTIKISDAANRSGGDV